MGKLILYLNWVNEVRSLFINTSTKFDGGPEPFLIEDILMDGCRGEFVTKGIKVKLNGILVSRNRIYNDMCTRVIQWFNNFSTW